MLQRLYAIARPSVTQVDQSKTVEVRNLQFSPHSSPITLVLRDKFHPEILMGSPSGDVKQGWGRKTSYFLNLCINISKTLGDMTADRMALFAVR